MMRKQTLLLAMAAGLASSAVLAEQTINLSYNGAADAQKNAVHAFAENLQQLVEEKTNGEITLKLYPNSMLGEEEARMEQTMTGPNLNIASFAGISPLVPEIYVSATPFMFADFAEARAFFDQGSYWQMVKDALKERAGVEMLAVVEEGGFLAFTNNERPIHEPKDFEGLRFRAMDPSQVALYEAFGASGTPIPWTEVYMALKTSVADGQMNPPMYIIMGSLYEVQKYLTLANIQYSDQFLVGNAAMLDSWDDATRQAFDEAVAEANEQARAANEAQVEERIAYLAEQGMEVIRPTDEQLEAFRKTASPAYQDWLQEQDIAQSYLDAAQADVAK
ncbi:TRAP transporter substrate-binding protein DctP [Suttonella sp. R2A3]|uniref:TRAP transporter substrate-binding protein DctP n=1 Tax=Suttonella sp. R2A3 TaxID=2908648 RepID=UPI001F16620B|nr:TRAP transporter substrate-binding protein DctP [Suttonella sp. R2A3]UJF24521.1 TRAP transporter substrate-binding protein DctP [Suttonella sp. R2A3]